MDEKDLIKDDGEMRYNFREIGTGEARPLMHEMVQEEMKPRVPVETMTSDKALRPIIRFFCDFPPVYPDDKRFGLQFTCLRTEDDGKKVVVKRGDEFHTMEKHTIPHETPDLPFTIQKLIVSGHQGPMARDLITVVLTPDEFIKLLTDLTRDEEITLDISRQISEAKRIREKYELTGDNPNYSDSSEVKVELPSFNEGPNGKKDIHEYHKKIVKDDLLDDLNDMKNSQFDPIDPSINNYNGATKK